MVLSARGLNKGDRSLDARWQRKYKEVKQRVANVDQLSEIDIRRWDLDTPERRPTGAKVDSNWKRSFKSTFDPADARSGGAKGRDRVDARDSPTIRDGDK